MNEDVIPDVHDMFNTGISTFGYISVSNHLYDYDHNTHSFVRLKSNHNCSYFRHDSSHYLLATMEHDYSTKLWDTRFVRNPIMNIDRTIEMFVHNGTVFSKENDMYIYRQYYDLCKTRELLGGYLYYTNEFVDIRTFDYSWVRYSWNKT